MDRVAIAIEGRVGRIRLSRPEALNALDLGMCAAMLEALTVWAREPAVHAVLIDLAEGRGFCAGGDVRMLAESGAGDGRNARAFFRTEYRLNARLFDFPKPTIAFMDGMTMGGGVGLALPCRYRVATENTRFAMPETAIGLFPDVSAGWYLSWLPLRVGRYLALTGHCLDGAECLALRLATHFVPSGALAHVKARLAADPAAVEAVLDEFSSPPMRSSTSALLDRAGDVERLFAADELEGVLAALEREPGEWAATTLATMRTRSPTSMKVALRLVREASCMPSFADEMRQEFAVASRVVHLPDFAEGVRAVLIDKDGSPRWDPFAPEDVTEELLDRIFAPLPSEEAWTPV